jgi:WD40 repeat protein
MAAGFAYLVEIFSESGVSQGALSHHQVGEFFSRGLAISPDGQTVAVGTFHEKLVLFQISTKKLQGTLEAPYRGHRQHLMFSPDGSILGASINERILFWEVKTGVLLKPLEMRGSILRFLPENKCLIADGSAVELVDLASGQVVKKYQPESGGTVGALSQDTTLVAAASGSKVLIWNLQTGKQVRLLEGHVEPVSCIAFSADGSLLASGSRDKTAIIWNLLAK